MIRESLQVELVWHHKHQRYAAFVQGGLPEQATAHPIDLLALSQITRMANAKKYARRWIEQRLRATAGLRAEEIEVFWFRRDHRGELVPISEDSRIPPARK